MGETTQSVVPQRVFITGANGFIGRALAQRYRSLGAEVCGTDFAADPAWNVVAGDVRQPETWRNQLAGADLVIHTAAVVSMTAPMRAAWDVNCDGTRRLLTACREQGVARFVQLSSVAAFGFDFPDERRRVAPAHHQRQLLRRYQDHERAHGARGPCRRRDRLHHHPAGRRLRPRIPRVGDRAAGNDACAVNSCCLTAGRGVFSPVYIDDLVDGIVLAAGKPEGAGQIFTLTSGAGVSCAEFFGHHWRWLGKQGSPRTLPTGLAIALAEAGGGIARLFGRSTELGRGSVGLLARPATYSIEKARRLLGYSPQVDLAEGMRRSEAWARDKGLCGSTQVDINDVRRRGRREMNKTRRILAACLGMALFSGGVLAGNSNGDWVKLGSVNAGHDADHDRITVTGQHDNYRKLKFKVKNASLNMRQVVVTYDDGAPERLEVKENLCRRRRDARDRPPRRQAQHSHHRILVRNEGQQGRQGGGRGLRPALTRRTRSVPRAGSDFSSRPGARGRPRRLHG